MTSQTTTGITIVVNAETAQAAQRMQQFLSSTSNGLKNMVANVAAIAGIGGLGYMFANAVREGIRFNAALQDATLGIAAIQKQFNPDRFKNFADAMKVSASAVDLLREKAIKSPASFQQLVSAFQGVTGAATSAGIGLREQVDLVVLMSQALAGLGIRSEQILQESRALLTGNITEDAMAARILGISKADIDQAKEAGQLYEFLTGKLQAFAEAGEVGAKNFTTAFSNLRDALEQKLARATETLFQNITEGLLMLTKALNDSDLFARIDAFVGVVIDFWKQGRIDELIGLTIQAGFEQGRVGLTWFGDQLKQFFTSESLKRMAINLSLILTRELAKALVDMSALLVQGVAEAISALVDLIVESVDGLMKWLESKPIFKKLFGETEWTKQGMGGFNIREGVDEYVRALNDGATIAKEGIDSFFNSGLQASNDYFGGNAPITQQATNQLTALIEQQMQLRDAAKKTAEIVNDTVNPTAAFDVKKFLAQEELKLKDRLLEIERARVALESNFTKSAIEKWAQRRQMLIDERAALESLLQGLREQADATRDEDTRQLLKQRSDKVETQLVGVQDDLGKMGPDPDSFSQNLGANLASLRDELGTFSQGAASVISNGLGMAINGVSDAIMGAIDGTRTWGQVFAQVGRQIIASIIQVVVNWIAQMTVLALLKKILQQEDTAAAAKSAAAWAPAAVAANIATFGAAAAIGTATAIAGMMAGAAVGGALGTVGGFAKGGFTGVGGKYEPAGIVHRGEFVMDADATSAIGVGPLEAMRTSKMIPAGNGAAAAAPAPVLQPKFNVFFDMTRWVAACKEDIESIAINATQGNRMRGGHDT